MHYPSFNVVRYGAFRMTGRSNPKFDNFSEISGNMVAAYEFEFYPEDCPGGLTVEGVRYQATTGHFSCCKPGQLRKMTLPYKCYFFNITTQDEEFRQILETLPTFSSHPDMDKILDTCRKMTSIPTHRTMAARLQVQSYICEILSLLLLQQYTVPNDNNANVRRHQQTLLAAEKYIREHITENIDLARLARDSGLHPTYFHKLFTSAFRKTPKEMLIWHRIVAAKDLLGKDSMPLSEISGLCGFSSPNQFSYIFRKETGMSPSQYRDKQRLRK